jgi:hypothetical protein
MKVSKTSSSKRSSSKSDNLPFLKKDPNEVQFETNFVAFKKNMNGGREDDAGDIEELRRIIQELREQRNMDSANLQEMQSQLDEVRGNDSSKTGIRLALKKSFSPVDVSEVGNHMTSDQVDTKVIGALSKVQSKVDVNKTTDQPNSNNIHTSSEPPIVINNEVHREMMKRKMKTAASERMKGSEAPQPDEEI